MQTEARSKEPLIVCLLALATSAYLHLRNPKIIDLDSMYHLGHARVYAERGPLDQSFPWAAFSTVGHIPADIWWGFHVFLLPFALLPIGFWDIKAAGIALTGGGAIISYFAGRKLGLTWAWIIPLVTVFASSHSVWRGLMVRPHVLSAAIMLFWLACILRCGRKECFLAGLAIGLIHQTVSWLIPPLMVVPLVVRGFLTKQWAFKEWLLGIAGIALAWLLRPNPLAALDQLKIQLVDLQQIRSSKIPLTFGTELNAMGFTKFWGSYQHFVPPFVLLAIVAPAILLFRKQLDQESKTLTLTSLLLLLGLGGLTILASNRGADQFLPILALSTCIGVNHALTYFRNWMPAKLVILAGFTALVGWTGYKSDLLVKKEADDIMAVKPAMDAIAKNTPEGSVVFHTVWSQFGQMFYWNRHNRYLGGMDPIFIYRYDTKAYWQMHHLWSQKSLTTTSTVQNLGAGAVDNYSSIKSFFGAKSVILETYYSKKLIPAFKKDKRFKLIYEDKTFTVFLVN